MSKTDFDSTGTDDRREGWREIFERALAVLGRDPRPAPIVTFPLPPSDRVPFDREAFDTAIRARDEAEANGTAGWAHIVAIIRALGFRQGAAAQG